MIKTPTVVRASTPSKPIVPMPDPTNPLDTDPEILIHVPLLLNRQTSGLSCLTQRSAPSPSEVKVVKQGDIETEDDKEEEEEENIPSTPAREKDKKCWAPDRKSTQTPYPAAEVEAGAEPGPNASTAAADASIIPEAQVVPETNDDNEDMVPGTPPREQDKKCWAPERPGPRKRKAEETSDDAEIENGDLVDLVHHDGSIITARWAVPKDKKLGENLMHPDGTFQASVARKKLDLEAECDDIDWDRKSLDGISLEQIRHASEDMRAAMNAKMQSNYALIVRRAIDFAKLIGGFNNVLSDYQSLTLIWTYSDNNPGVLQVIVTPTQMELITRDGSKVKVGSPEMAAHYFKPFISGISKSV